MTAVSGKLDMTVSGLQPASNVTVHGVFVEEVSPLKDSKTKKGLKYCEGNLSDGKKRACVVVFTSRLHQQIVKAQKEGTNIALEDCIVQTNKWRPQELEIIANARTKIRLSPKRFKVDHEGDDLAEKTITSITVIHNIGVRQTVAVKGKVVKMLEPEAVYSKGKEKTLKKQELLIADEDSTIRGVLWESQVKVLSLGKTYMYVFKDARISQYEAKYLSFPESTVFEPTDDIEEVVEFEEEEEQVTGLSQAVVVGEIVEVLKVERYNSCRNCSSKVTKKTNVTGECSKCKSRMKLSRRSAMLTAHIVIENENDAACTVQLTTFGNVIMEIIEEIEGEDVEEKLLNSPKMKYFFNISNIVTRVSSV